MSTTIVRCAADVAAVTVPARITASDTKARTITGPILTYGETGENAFGKVRFVAGAIRHAADHSRVKLLVEHDPNRVVGYATDVTEKDGTVWATFSVPETPEGDEVLMSAAQKRRDGLSVGVQVIESADKDGVMEVTAGALRETSVVAMPAFVSARIASVAASQTPPAPGPAHPAPAAPAAPVPAGPAHYTAPAAATDTFAGAVSKMAAAYNQDGPSGMVRAALSDVVMPTDPAQRDVVARPGWLGELWEAEQDTRRPLIDAIGVRPLTAYRMQGFRIERPAFGVGPYAGDKAAIPSPGGYGVTPADVTAQRIAGGHDIDRVFFDFPASYGSESFLDAYFRYQTSDYRKQTEEAVATAMQAEAAALTATDALGAIKAVAAAAAERRVSVSFLSIAADLWAALLDIPDSEKPWLFGGSMNLTGDTAQVGGVTFSLNYGLAAGTVLGGDRRAVTYWEKNPPIHVQAVNIPNGGIDLALFGYYALLVNDPASLFSVTVSAGV